MMNKYFSVASLGVMMAWVAPALAIDPLPYENALQKAVLNKKAVVVLCDGSDWLPQSEKMRTAYQTLIDNAGDTDAFVIWAIQDEKNVQTEEEKKQKRPPLKVWNYPAIQIVDSEGLPLYMAEGVTEEALTKKFPAMIKKVLDARAKRDKIWTDGKDKTGVAAAEVIGRGLDLLPENAAREYKGKIEEIKKADPKDEKGYHLKYTYNFQAFKEGEIMKRIEEKKYDEAYKFVDEKLKSSILTKYQRQSILASKFAIARAEGDLPKALNYLKQVISLAPGTEFSQASQKMIDIYTKPVTLTDMKWRQSDNRPVWLPMRLDITSKINGTGTYEIEFKHQEGHTKFRKASLINATGKEMAKSPDANEATRFSLDLLEGSPKVILQVESMGTGWFSGCGDIIVTKK